MKVGTRINEEIKKDIVDQLYWDSRVDASNVNVEVSDGEVTLSGTVPNYTAYDAADEDAWTMLGVLFVNNKLTIQYPDSTALPPDDELEVNIKNILLWQPNIDSAELDVSVENGWVTLRGTVDTYWKKVKAGELTLGLSGVLGITNEIAVVPSESYTDKAIADDIESAMERNFNLDQSMIDVAVENGRITLTGSVRSLVDYKASQKIAENTLCV